MLSQLHGNKHYIIHALFLEIQIFFIPKNHREKRTVENGNKLVINLIQMKKDLSLHV